MTQSIQLWKEYISSDPTYQYLCGLKKKGWLNPDGDKFFEDRKRNATNPDPEVKESLYNMTLDIGNALASTTGVFKLESSYPRILDLCMAPGGFSATAKRELPESIIDAITLPPQTGGYEVMADNICRHITYADITMYSKEMISDGHIPADRPDSERFETSSPYVENQYDIVICGGAVAKAHLMERHRSECERSLLTVSQLVFAMNRLKPGGSIVLLLHHVESWDTVCILHAFNQFSHIQLFKHPKCHAIKSSFYLVAKNIDLHHENAIISLS
ncbi:hypothetical protein ACN38_g13213, partial [Penicillium nordicum]